MSQIIFDSLDAFIEALQSRRIPRIAYAITDERRAVEHTPGNVDVIRVHMGEALAYHESTILKFTAHDDDTDISERTLIDSGFEVIRRDRNIISQGK